VAAVDPVAPVPVLVPDVLVPARGVVDDLRTIKALVCIEKTNR
jgi:hypothetical protein